MPASCKVQAARFNGLPSPDMLQTSTPLPRADHHQIKMPHLPPVEAISDGGLHAHAELTSTARIQDAMIGKVFNDIRCD